MQADLVLYNGTVHTLDRQRPHARAVAIAANRIVGVGNDAEMRGLLRPGGQSIDLRGRTVTPGFTDAHIHFLWYGWGLRQIVLAEVPSLEAALERVAERAATTPAGQWLIGQGWNQSLWWSGGAFPNRGDLDRVTQEHPVYLRRKCGHIGWANSRALEIAGITAQTPDPPGGEIERDPVTGEPTGILKERAMELIARLVREPSGSEAVAAVSAAMEHVHTLGIVGIHNMEGKNALTAFQQLREENRLRLRVTQQIPEADMEAAIQLGIRSGYGDECIRFGAVKIFADGALGARTAQMIDPYEGEPDNLGICVSDAEHLKRQVAKASAAGLAVHIHAIGDLANRNVLDAIEASQREGLGTHLRHRIEHAQVLHPDDIGRFAQLGVVASMQPIHCTQDMQLADAHWGAARSRYAYAWRSLRESGAALAFGSDAPVEDPSVIRGIHAAVTRRLPDGSPGADGWYPEQRISVEEAVHAYTAGAAYSVGLEKEQGRIAPGMLADLVVLSDDIFSIHPMALLETDVLATMVDGEFVFTHDDF
jgi:predicted amidohydrolase YtcJ